ncbi:MAG: hypothetical protein B6245_16885 [Desulfobacteraceae bacterium 4572_88]|nr:MAG: hypothetical protein B6245_16885 [Desulfobacteraceae bacterium 4572_88]
MSLKKRSHESIAETFASPRKTGQFLCIHDRNDSDQVCVGMRAGLAAGDPAPFPDGARGRSLSLIPGRLSADRTRSVGTRTDGNKKIYE